MTRTQALEDLAGELVVRENRWKDAWESGELSHEEAVSATQEDRWVYSRLQEILAEWPEQEPVYEWGAFFRYHPDMDSWYGRRENAQAEPDEYPEHGGKLYRRTKAGPWEEVL